MDNTLRGASGAAAPYDLRQYDRLWQRVAPSLEPFPEALSAPETAAPAVRPPAPAQLAAVGRGEDALPGAQADPCCMGSAAAEMLEVLEGFLDDELADCRYYAAMARCAPAWARQSIRSLGLEELGHAKLLQAVYYLITGRCRTAPLQGERIYIGPWCPALRERYHAEVCGGLNYIRASEGTTDPCLAKILAALSEEEYRQAQTLTELLERSLGGACTGRGTGV